MAGAIVKTLKLKDPIEQGDGQPPITELNFRKPEAGDLWNLPLTGATMGDQLECAGKLCGMLGNELKKLSVADMFEVVSFFGTFFPGGPPTGKK